MLSSNIWITSYDLASCEVTVFLLRVVVVAEYLDLLEYIPE